MASVGPTHTIRVRHYEMDALGVVIGFLDPVNGSHGTAMASAG